MQQSLITQKLVIGNCTCFSQNFRQQIWQHIYEHILERSHSDVRCARDGSRRVHLSRLTWEPTAESDPTGKFNHLPIALLLWYNYTFSILKLNTFSNCCVLFGRRICNQTALIVHWNLPDDFNSHNELTWKTNWLVSVIDINIRP